MPPLVHTQFNLCPILHSTIRTMGQKAEGKPVLIRPWAPGNTFHVQDRHAAKQLVGKQIMNEP